MHGEAGLEPVSPYVRWGDISNLVLDMAPYPTIPNRHDIIATSSYPVGRDPG